MLLGGNRNPSAEGRATSNWAVRPVNWAEGSWPFVVPLWVHKVSKKPLFILFIYLLAIGGQIPMFCYWGFVREIFIGAHSHSKFNSTIREGTLNQILFEGIKVHISQLTTLSNALLANKIYITSSSTLKKQFGKNCYPYRGKQFYFIK